MSERFDPEYIIVQAGGKGTRMEYLTTNKPKALVPINNLPMLFHLFKKYPDKHFVIIGDYKYDVLKRYLAAFAKVKYLLVDARGKAGTCAGLKEAAGLIPDNESLMLIWSDLILPKKFVFPANAGNYVGLSGDFRCRWKYENGEYEEEPSIEYGVAGLFIFENKSVLKDVPAEGEFVRWLKDIDFKAGTHVLSKTKEYGLISEYNKLKTERCRPFNKMSVVDGKIVKEGIDEQGRSLAVREKAWYKYVEPLGFSAFPKIYDYEPFTMEKVEGKNIYEYDELSKDEKREILAKIIGMLKNLHSLESGPVDYYSMKEAYVTKTWDRLNKIRNLVPFANDEYITVNGKRCHNIFYITDEVEERVNAFDVKEFKLLHGDNTFSNMMLRNDTEPIVIDPRGYFGYTEMLGDPAYDWAKLYYSVVGNYDRFNLKKFRLIINEDSVDLEIESNGWEDLKDDFFELIGDEAKEADIKLIHAIIWLSLTTYAWEDYDSICGAFYNGLYYLEEAMYGE